MMTMRVRLAAAVVATVSVLGAVAVPASADTKGEPWVPPGLAREDQAEWKDGRPPGWSQGAKRGWRGRDCPPGLAKKGRCGEARVATPQAKSVEDAVRDGIERLRKWAREKLKLPPRALEAVLVGFEGAARNGVPAPVAERLVMATAERGVTAYGIEATAGALAYGPGRGARPAELESFTAQALQREVPAEAIALGLYRLGAEVTR